MKKTLSFALVLIGLLNSVYCVSEPQYPQYPQQQYPQYPQQYSQPYYGQQLSQEQIMQQKYYETIAKMDVCEYLSTQWGDKEIRAHGEGTGFDKESAKKIALMNAQDGLIKILKTWVSDFEERTVQEIQKNKKINKEAVRLEEQQRIAESSLRGQKIVLIDYKDTDEGYVYCSVCLSTDADAAMQMIIDQSEIAKALDNSAKIREIAEEAKEKVRFDQTGENRATKMAAKENEIQQNNMNQQHQRNMEMAAMQNNRAANNNYQYTIQVNGQTYGPYTYSQLVQFVPTRQLTQNSMVIRQGLSSYQPAGTLPELQSLFSSTPMPNMPPVMP